MYGRADPDLTAVPSFLASVRRTFLSCLISRQITLAALVLAFQAGAVFAGQARTAVPERIPLKRSVQIVNGFGINTPLPRQPYLPWDRRWWTRLFDAGYGWVSIGQYENSSEQTSWDWVEQNRGIYRISPEVDDYVDSLVENGVKVQLQLLYGNPMYTSRAGRLPDLIQPAPPGAHPPDEGISSIFWGPSTPEQIAGFIKYTTFVVNHFRGRIRYYALWNEEDEYFWNKTGNAADYGRLLAQFIRAVRDTDPAAKIVFGGLGSTRHEFPPLALDACRCAADIDVFAYHSYPGFGTNTNPELMDEGPNAAAILRKTVRMVPGIRTDIEFWDDEYNSIPQWKGSDESVQAKYAPRALLYNWANGVRTFIWQLTAGVDGSEFDNFGLLHGMAYRAIDFQPLKAFETVANTNALFADTKLDRSIEVTAFGAPADAPFMAYGYRARSGKAIVAWWLAAHSEPGGRFPDRRGGVEVKNSGIERPVLIDVDSGKIARIEWKTGTRTVLAAVPLRDSVMAIADADYFDWPVLPEAPSSLKAKAAGGAATLTWEVHGGGPQGVIVERRNEDRGAWAMIARLPDSSRQHTDPGRIARTVSYRVRTFNSDGLSAYSNIVRLKKVE